MAVRRLNYTGRKRLSQADVRIFLEDAGGGGSAFGASLSLGDYELPQEAKVFVEAYRQTSFMRFACGTVGALQLPADRRLHEFGSTDGVLFRVRVSSASEPEGLLLAEADAVAPCATEEEEQKTISLLPVRSAPLGDQVFRVDFSDRPILLVNVRVGDWRTVSLNPVFTSLVLPAAMREVLTRILHIDDYFDVEEGTTWQSQWLGFARSLPGVPAVPSKGQDAIELDQWIEEAVDAFCKQRKMFPKFEQYLTGEVSS